MFWWFRRKQIFYDPDKCERIMYKYNPNGGRDMQILRALAGGELKPSDIKKYHNYGECYPAWSIGEYRLINDIVTANSEGYIVKRFESGAFHSKLAKVELYIENGIGYITEYWIET